MGLSVTWGLQPGPLPAVGSPALPPVGGQPWGAGGGTGRCPASIPPSTPTTVCVLEKKKNNKSSEIREAGAAVPVLTPTAPALAPPGGVLAAAGVQTHGRALQNCQGPAEPPNPGHPQGGCAWGGGGGVHRHCGVCSPLQPHRGAAPRHPHLPHGTHTCPMAPMPAPQHPWLPPAPQHPSAAVWTGHLGAPGGAAGQRHSSHAGVFATRTPAPSGVGPRAGEAVPGVGGAPRGAARRSGNTGCGCFPVPPSLRSPPRPGSTRLPTGGSGGGGAQRGQGTRC